MEKQQWDVYVYQQGNGMLLSEMDGSFQILLFASLRNGYNGHNQHYQG